MKTDPPYRTDLINAAMGARRLTNETLAKLAGRLNYDCLKNS
jgi:hypothetical protein